MEIISKVAINKGWSDDKNIVLLTRITKNISYVFLLRKG